MWSAFEISRVNGFYECRAGGGTLCRRCAEARRRSPDTHDTRQRRHHGRHAARSVDTSSHMTGRREGAKVKWKHARGLLTAERQTLYSDVGAKEPTHHTRVHVHEMCMCRCMEFFDERLGCAKDKCKVVAVTCDGGAEPCCQGAGELGSLSVCRCSAAPRAHVTQIESPYFVVSPAALPVCLSKLPGGSSL